MTEQELEQALDTLNERVEQALAAMNERLLRLEFNSTKTIFMCDGLGYHFKIRGIQGLNKDEYEKEFAEWRRKREAS